MGAFYTPNGFSSETWSVLGICLGVLLVIYRLTRRRIRRRRLVAMELRLESAWEDVKASIGMPGRVASSRRPVGMASSFLEGLSVGVQGRVLSMHPLDPKVGPLSAHATAASAILPAASNGPGAGTTEETAQQTGISCDI